MHPKQVEMLENMPKIETKHRKSKDGKWYMVTTTITDIKSVEYIDKVLKSENKPEDKPVVKEEEVNPF